VADYSWASLTFHSQDPEVVAAVAETMGVSEGPFGQIDNAGTEWSVVQGETSYGLADAAEAYLTERGIAWSRVSDGKYEYDGDEAHWAPGMEAPRAFSRLNNEGRVLTNAEVRALEDKTDAELGAYVREHFAFSIEGGDDE
jgi:hypothetical protein